MRFRVYLALSALVLSQPANAAISIIDAMWTVSSPDTPDTFITLYCNEGNMVENLSNGNIYRQRNCAGARFNELYISAASQVLFAQTSNAAWRSTMFTGTTAQYVQGDGSLATLNKAAVGLGNVDNTADSAKTFAASQITSGTKTSAFISDFTTASRNSISVTGNGSYNSSTGVITINGAGSRTFSTPTRTLGTCFQISATNDADFHYGVDAAILLSLGTSSVNVTSYTNSGCTTGAIVETASSDNGIGVGVTRTMRMDGIIQGGRWAKITATTTGGFGSTMTIRTDQREIIQP